jgi:hypothetical protein
MALSKLPAAFLHVVCDDTPDRIRDGVFLPEVRDRVRPGEGQLCGTQGEEAEGVFRRDDPHPVSEFWIRRGGVGGGDVDGGGGLGRVCDSRTFLLVDGNSLRVCGKDCVPGPPGNHFLPDRGGLVHPWRRIWRGGNGSDGGLFWFRNLESVWFSGRTVQRVADRRRGFLIILASEAAIDLTWCECVVKSGPVGA